MKNLYSSTVFEFNVWFDNDIENTQVRHVVAKTPEEAEEKMEACNEIMVKNGFANMTWADPIVAIDFVIG